MLLDQIEKANDIKQIAPEDYPVLASEIRQFLIEKVSEHGGHLASNLGVVELTMALHIVFDLPKDKLIFDVGHQCYTHKLLTGRREGFDHLREYGGMSGFPKRAESDCDVFDTGHSSTSLSSGLGLAQARELTGEDYHVVSVIGDGSMTGGMAFEALNNASQLKSNFIIVLNDNDMSIDGNVGGMSSTFQSLRTAPRYNRIKQNVKTSLDKIPNVGGRMVRRIGKVKDVVKQVILPNMFFETMGLTYLGPIDGHDTEALIRVLRDASRVERAVVVHIVTKKGKGYRFAEKYPERFHGVGPFDVSTGKPKSPAQKSYTDYVSEGILNLGRKDDRVVAITAAMAGGTGLTEFHKHFPDRFFDVGIAEQHAVTFAAGLAAGGLKPYVCIYSSFLQRAYDQIIHDVALERANVTFLIDRAGLVGQDGVTHHGMLDGSFLQTVPNLTLLAPRDGQELLQMMEYSLSFEGPLAIRYPRGSSPDPLMEKMIPARSEIVYNKAELVKDGRDIVLFAAGSQLVTALYTAELLKEDGLCAGVVNARFLKPFDRELLGELGKTHPLIAVLEENNRSGGLGEHIADYFEAENIPARLLNLSPDIGFYPQGKTEELRDSFGLSAEKAAARIRQEWESMQS